jgi:RNA polymerase sigma-70 factor (ECF subfamily)
MNEKHNEQILEAIRNNDRSLLQDFYNENRKSFLSWCIKRFQLSEEDSIEIYQQAYIVLFDNVQRGKLERLSSKPFTYLCSVGRNLMLQRSRGKSYYMSMTVEDIEEQNQEMFISEEESPEEVQAQNKQLVKHLLSKIGDPCATILEMLFVKGMHPEAVASAMNYSDERVVRKRKSLCLKRMREMVQEEANQNSSPNNEFE